MQTELSVVVQGDIDRLYALAAAVPKWAEFLPHYRFVSVLGATTHQRTVAMSAWRGWLSLRWTSILELVPDERRIIFQHIGGGARGMYVEWRIVQEGGVVRATIMHDLSRLDHRIVATALGRHVLSHWLIDPIATKTLAHMRDLIETGRDGEASSTDSELQLVAHSAGTAH